VQHQCQQQRVAFGVVYPSGSRPRFRPHVCTSGLDGEPAVFPVGSAARGGRPPVGAREEDRTMEWVATGHRLRLPRAGWYAQPPNATFSLRPRNASMPFQQIAPGLVREELRIAVGGVEIGGARRADGCKRSGSKEYVADYDEATIEIDGYHNTADLLPCTSRAGCCCCCVRAGGVGGTGGRKGKDHPRLSPRVGLHVHDHGDRVFAGSDFALPASPFRPRPAVRERRIRYTTVLETHFLRIRGVQCNHCQYTSFLNCGAGACLRPYACSCEARKIHARNARRN
jgi:hypothetical protein